MRPHPHAAVLGTIVLLIALQIPACSVFSTIGDTASQGYENTVSYFNAYYNAQRLFAEAEDEIRAAELAMRGKTVPGVAPSIPPTAKAKLTTVIDKCSNILAFHPTAGVVDDALLMIGKSFFYMGEYLKAERKFAELQSQYPASDLIPETQYWYARSEERLNKLSEALQACDSLIVESIRADDREREVDAELLKAAVLTKLGEPARAVETLRQALERSPGDELSARIHTTLGDLHVSTGAYEDAVKDYLAVPDLTEDLYDSYYANFHAAISWRALKQFDRSLAILDGMVNNFRYKEWYSSVMYERGRTLAEEGNVTDAVDAFRIVDTSAVRSDYSPRAALELGRIFERVLLDYDEARRYYGRVTTASVPKIAEEAKRKFAALNRYFDTSRKLFEQDSLWQAAHDTTARPAPPPPSVPKPSDTPSDMPEEQVESVRDTMRMRPVVAAITDPDSLRRARLTWKQDLADIFYSELDVPDSAVVYYEASMREGTDSLRTPRVLFILGELARSNPDKGFTPAEERYRQLIDRYPHSEYAREARRLLGERVSELRVDPAETLYRDAEKLLDANKPEAAVEKLRRLAAQYPGSPFASKAEYAIAWIQEYHLNQPEKAVEQYRRVVALHGRSRFAPPALQKVVLANARRDSIAADSIRRVIADSVSRAAVADSVRLRAATARADSAKPMSLTPADSASRVKTVTPADTVRKPAPPGPSTSVLDSLKQNLRTRKQQAEDDKPVSPPSPSPPPDKPDDK